MKDRLPRPREMVAFAVLALACALAAGLISHKDGTGLAVMGAPIFLVGAIMGLRRSGEVAAADADDADPQDPA